MSTVSDTAAADQTLSGPSPRVWTFMPLHGKNGEGHFAFLDADSYEWAQSHRWQVNAYGYAVRSEYIGANKYRPLLLHRRILDLQHGDGLEADHINRDRLDNRRCNLRVCTRAENAQNTVARGERARGAHAGRRGKFRARVGLKGAQHQLGEFDTEQEAAEAAAAWRAEHMPFSAEARKET